MTRPHHDQWSYPCDQFKPEECADGDDRLHDDKEGKLRYRSILPFAILPDKGCRLTVAGKPLSERTLAGCWSDVLYPARRVSRTVLVSRRRLVGPGGDVMLV